MMYDYVWVQLLLFGAPLLLFWVQLLFLWGE